MLECSRRTSTYHNYVHTYVHEDANGIPMSCGCGSVKKKVHIYIPTLGCSDSTDNEVEDAVIALTANACLYHVSSQHRLYQFLCVSLVVRFPEGLYGNVRLHD